MAASDSGFATQQCPACGAALDVSQAEPLARVVCPECGEKVRVERAFDNFALLETLGVGGMGSVYKARDTRLDRFVALKLLRSELSADPAEAARLEQEARVTAAVNHPHVVQVFSSGHDHGQFYIVMEIIEHGSLDDLMAQHGRISEVQVLEIGIQVAQGLHAAYEKGLIHRDIKPANILFASERTAKIGDFGLAVAAEQNAETRNEIWGTPYYVAPERLESQPEDFRSDIYSLGATLFHAVTGQPPIEGETNSAAVLRQLKAQPPDMRRMAPDISKPTARVLSRMLAPDPDARFASYAELIQQLQRAFDKLTGVNRPRRTTWIALAAALAIVAAGSALYVRHVRESERANSVSLNQLFADARRALVAGKIDVARNEFGRLAETAKDRQPIWNWIRLNRGMASLIRGYAPQARQIFAEVKSGGLYSTKPADAELARFFVDTAAAAANDAPIKAAGVAQTRDNSAQAFALLLFAIKDWHQRDFDDAAELLRRFTSATPPEPFKWISDYKPLAQKYLGDYELFTNWEKQPKTFETAERTAAALATLRDVISKLQTRGPLPDALKQEETALMLRAAAKPPDPR